MSKISQQRMKQMKLAILVICVAGVLWGTATSCFGENFPMYSELQTQTQFVSQVKETVLHQHKIDKNGEGITLLLAMSKAKDEESIGIDLLAKMVEKDFSLWRVSIDRPSMLPLEYEFILDKRSETVGLCFLLHWGEILFYEIKLDQLLSTIAIGGKLPKALCTWDTVTYNDADVLLSAKRLHVSKSVWGIPNREFRDFRDLKLVCDGSDWLISGRAKISAQGGDQYIVATLKVPVRGKDSEFQLISKRGETEKENLMRRCLETLERIKGAKEQWSMAERKKTGNPVLVEGVDEYIKGGHPRCPAGGEYIYGAIGEVPKCTIHGASE
jgi:hypothetical protein